MTETIISSFSHLSLDEKDIMHRYEACAYPDCGSVRPCFSFDFVSPRYCAGHKQEGMYKVTKGKEKILLRFLQVMVKEGVFDAEKVNAALRV